MPDITLIKLKIRRGTDAQRQAVILEQGELGYTIDTNRVFVGNGVTPGGTSVSTIAHQPTRTAGSRLNLTTAVRGDIICDSSLLFQLTGTNSSALSSWAFIGPKADENTLTYNNTNRLSIRDNGITGSKFSEDAAKINGGINVDLSQGLYINVDNVTLRVDNTNFLSVSSINQNNITSSSLGQGLKGGSGQVLGLNVDTGTFNTSTGVLSLCSIPDGILNRSAFATGVLGTGLDLSDTNVIKTVVTDVDTSTLDRTVAGVVGLKPIGDGGTSPFCTFTYDTYGRIVGNPSSSIIDTLSSLRTSTDRLSVFNGNLEQTTFSNNTLITVRTNENLVVTLSSAGFMSIDTVVGRVAIPVFKY